MSAPLVLVLPMPPNLANGRMHYRVAAACKKGYYAACDMLILGSFSRGGLNDYRAMVKIGQRPRTNDTLKREIARIHERVSTAGTRYVTSCARARWPRVEIRSVMTLGTRMDTSNAMNRHKWPEDWLVTRGFLAGDREKNLVWAAFPEQVISRTLPPEIKLTLTPLAGAEAA